MKQLQYDDDGTPYGYKYVLMGMYWSGEEPTMYPEYNYDDEDEDCFDVEGGVDDAINEALKAKHPSLEVIDVAFLFDGVAPDYWYRPWTKGHVKEVVRHFLWVLFLKLR